MQALVVTAKGKLELKEVEKPVISDGEILVQVEYVALNPTDWKHRDSVSPAGVILGCDFCGTIVESKSSRPKGQRVAGWVHGGKFPDQGSFAQYIRVAGDRVFTATDLKPESAATFGIGYFTAAMALFNDQKLPYPPAAQEGWFFVGGGSSSVGLFVTQLARIVGYKVIATASPHSFDIVKAHGANRVVDYHDPKSALDEIKKVTDDGIVAGLECIGDLDGVQLAVDSFGPKGGPLTQIIPPPKEVRPRPEVPLDHRILLYTAQGYEFEFIPGQPKMPAKPEDLKWFTDFCERSPEFIEKHDIKGNPVDLRQGLENINQGLDEMKAGKVSGKKLVYKIA
ncbi:chaperonin 10-like protein [Kockovaella imperatae]|uniref:Chaperonin 10-like protein n=1 Tax=Kockovaella imperatae TaxID=4999 RepID=A0A1Y1UE10_9TREE|nr:chaperonin 10-like protein [Kockovaella imperatae]ORX35746.1 chaperonin 10-like protein [Kockovaella imperatae]